MKNLNKILYTTLLTLGLAAFVRHDVMAQINPKTPDTLQTINIATDSDTNIDKTCPYEGATYSADPLCKYDYTLKNPMDLGTVHRILDDVFWNVLQTTPDTQKIVIIMGEDHHASMTQLPQGLMLSSLVAYRDSFPNDPLRNFIFSYELPYNNAIYYAKNFYDQNIPETTKESFYNIDSLQKYDPNGHIQLLQIMGDNRYPKANTMNDIFYYVIKNNIPTIFGDAARTRTSTIDFKDPVAAYYAKERFNLYALDTLKINRLNNRTPKGTNTFGLQIRNFGIADRSITYAYNKNARIIFQQCGLFHVGGAIDIDDEITYIYPDETSLKTLYKNAGFRVISVFLHRSTPDNQDLRTQYPIETWQNPHDHDNIQIVIRNLDCTHYNSPYLPKQYESTILDVYKQQTGTEFPINMDEHPPFRDSILNVVNEQLFAPLTPSSY